MIRGGSDGWAAPGTLATIAVGIGVIALFVRHEAHTAEPMLDLSVFRNPRFAGASVAVTAVYFCLFGTIFLLTQHLQVLLGYGALAAGVRTVPFAAVLIVVANLTPRIVGRFGPRLPIVVGLLVVAVSQLLRIASTPDSGYGIVLASQMTFAAGMGLLIAPATASIMGSVPAARAGVGSAINDTTRQVGGALGVAVMGSVAAAGYRSDLVAPGAVGGLGRPRLAQHRGADRPLAGNRRGHASRRRRAARVHPRAAARVLRRLCHRADRRGGGLASAAGWRCARHPCSATPVERTRSRGGRVTTMTGVAMLQAIKSGDAPAPGIADLLGFTLTRVQPGHVECELETRDDMTNPMGSVHGGIAATLLDTVMGCAVQTTLDDGEAFTTTDLQVHYVRTVNPGTAVHATGTVIHRGRRLATAEGRLVDERGKLVAHATTSCMILPSPVSADLRLS